eukprot:Em0016g1129a
MEKKIGSMLQEVAELVKSNPRGAVIKLTRAIALQPKNAELFRQRAEAYEALFDYHPAILNFRKALLLGPLNKEALTFRLAEVYCAYGERLCEGNSTYRALEMFKMALEYQPHNREITCLSVLKRYDECIEMIKKQLEEEGTSSGLYTSRSVLHMMFGNNTQAFYDACRALELDPSNFEASHLKDELEAKAESFKSQAIAHALVVGVLSIQYGIAAADTDLHDFAIECFSQPNIMMKLVTLLNKAIKSEKKEKGLYVNRGEHTVLQALKNIPDAEHDLARALYLEPTSENCFSVMARVCPGKTKEDILKNYNIPAAVCDLDMASHLNTCTMTNTPSSLGCLSPSKNPNPHHPSTHSPHQERDFHMELFYCKKAATEEFKRIMDELRPLHLPALKLLPLERTL